MPDLEDMQRQAADPHTPLSTLQSIAQDYPALRPVLALNPSTYPGLLEWLRDLDEPEVNQALAERARREAASEALPDEVVEPAPVEASPAPESAPVEASPQTQTDPATTQEPATAVPENRVPSKALKPARPASHMHRPEAETAEADTGAGPARRGGVAQAIANVLESNSATAGANAAAAGAAATDAAATPPPAPNSATSTQGSNAGTSTQGNNAGTSTGENSITLYGSWYPPVKPEAVAVAKKNRRSPLLWFEVGIAAVCVMGFAVINAINDTSENMAQQEQATHKAFTTPDPPTPTPQVTTLLPQGYDGPTKIVEKPGAHPGETLMVVVPDPDGDKPKATPTKTSTPTPTNALAAPSNAKRVASFTTADGNVRCNIGDDLVQCVANQLNVATNCETRSDETAYTLTLYPQNYILRNCITPSQAQTQGVLAPGEAAASNQFACKNSKAGDLVMCWNLKSGDGFTLGLRNFAMFEQGSTLPDFE